MKAVIQRVSHAQVDVDGKTVGKIGVGYLILLGVMDGDGKAQAELLARKTAELRINEDENGKMNLSLVQIGGAALAVSQFTLCADVSHGRRPSFTPSAPPAQAEALYRYYCEQLRQNGVQQVETGVFGADMQVSLCNDGPVTMLLDTDIWERKG
ncbi:MAG: D-tyrosyl-tRNA(Tyr) deacylase [Clostridia bacterium]|jgi:D-tyrosyl-tRNA(Tyr) deacylase|nr:D-tyrosyl-tRNA(Tyr) deacylase [Clostridia bacterium]MBR3096015.1 D-tyrosyl-tRNA(Tyr) deacylase [Clostridia bacterium]